MPNESSQRTLSTAEERRATVMRTAIAAFAARGFYGTTTTEVAKHAGISQAYLYRLFPDKEALFVAVVDYCALRIRECLAEGAARTESGDPRAVLAAMADSYAQLISDRSLLMVLMQANCAASEPAIRDAVQACYARQVEYVRAVSGAPEEQIQQFFARGFLCNAVVAMGATDVEAPWAHTLTLDLLHYPSHGG
ncbi:TetR/AcrR family transcriptional regulator [Actinoallomurus rhizosphaericola]|uniref:TetR/AcrR family transcriptional regulator n=1 Tax=Actinoallomurus rhizosphaericola TaxID=2952536 RepID=UPI002092593B|nr:TetR/AcrR family transcriptional regulator [Actinoallomurus rhizosphaericola]MCO6000217.1 TetR/AcrR family transcriptional regulator [Actinoallomurus rhizosphaericola]